jgi:hypothetical protein
MNPTLRAKVARSGARYGCPVRSATEHAQRLGKVAYQATPVKPKLVPFQRRQILPY